MKLVPPGRHRCNAAEVAIHNFKAHFLSVLTGVADNFPPNLWDWLLPQTKITINLIWQSNATPNVLAYSHLSGPFDYNKKPLASLGCEAQVHETTDKHGTWAYHSVNGWYLFTSLEHYCTHNCHIKHTKSEQLSNMVQLQHKGITNPSSITHADKVMHVLADCIKDIQGLTGKARTSQDLQQIVDATQAHLQAHPNKFEETTTPDATRNTQQVPRVQAPPRVPTTHINDNRRITRSMRPKPSVPRVPNNKPTSKPTSAPSIKPTNEPTRNPTQVPTINHTNLSADWSTRESLQKWQAAQLCNAATSTSKTPCPRIRTQSQVATAAAQVAPPSLSTHSWTQQLGVPLQLCWPGFTVAVMRQQRHQHCLVCLTRRISQLENEVYQAMAVMDKDMGKLLNYKQLMSSSKYRKAWEPFISQQIWAIGKWHQRSNKEPYQHY
jgi:hypothetical protein